MAAGAATVVVSGFLPWLHLARGYSGYRLSGLVRSLGDDYPLVPPSWVGLAWWVVPLLGATCWVVLFVGGAPRVRAVHGLLGAGLAVVSLAFVGVATQYGRLAAGQIVALAGAAAVLAGWAIGTFPHRRRECDTNGL